MREGSGAIQTSYDDADRVVRVITDSASGRNELAYEYDTLDRVVTRTVNGADNRRIHDLLRPEFPRVNHKLANLRISFSPRCS